ncbi:MAG: acyltransferase [Bacteroidota bacterium]
MKKLIKVLRNKLVLLFRGRQGLAKFMGVTIGNDCRIFTTNFGSEPFLITIGNKVTVTKGVRFVTHNGSTWLIEDEAGRRYEYRRIEVGNNVFIGTDALILPGVKIEDNCIVAAGAIVTKSIPAGSIVGGNPAKIIGSFDLYKEKALENFPSAQQMDKTKAYKERILPLVDNTFKVYLQTKS